MPLSVSVVVPTFNRAASLRRLLEALAGQTYPSANVEVLVVDDGSTDGTSEMLASLRTSYHLHTLRQTNGGPAAARNHALAVAGGDVVLFLDDDVLPVDDLIWRHVQAHERDALASVLGPMLPPAGGQLAPWLQWEAMTLQKQYDALAAGTYQATPRQFYTANASVRRECVLAAGGFDETFTRAEDVELADRLAERGVRFHFVPEAVVWHTPHRTLQSWLRVPYEYGRHSLRMSRGAGSNDVHSMFAEWRTRHPLNRALSRWCVGHPWRLRAVVGAGTRLLALRGPQPLERLQLRVCSALFTLRFWEGVADATELGPYVWRTLSSGQAIAATSLASAPAGLHRT